MSRWARLENGNECPEAGRNQTERGLTEALGKAQADGIKRVTDLFHRQSCFNSNMPDPCTVKMHDNAMGTCILRYFAYIPVGDDGTVEGIL